MSSDKLNGIIGAQIGVKQKTSLGYEHVAIPPPSNHNYTSLPHFSHNIEHEDEMVYGIGHVPKPIIFVPKVSKTVDPIDVPMSSNDDSSCLAGHVKGCDSIEKRHGLLK